jgi:DNA ligase-1
MRPSPTESATLFSVGFKKKGNDGNNYIIFETSSGQHRWKKTINKSAIKKSATKNRSTKKRSTKKSATKKRSPKKRSTKKRSTKKSATKKRSTKKRSTKKSATKKSEIKKRSPKKSATKKSEIKKRSPKKSATKKSEIKKQGKYNPKTFKTMLANSYKDQDISDFFVSEKLDGVRAIYYNGKFTSRNNKELFCPEWFVKDFPKNTVIDGELFTKRDDFSKILSIVKKHNPIDSEWKTIKFMAFDLPFLNEPFHKRYAELLRISKSKEYMKVVINHKIKNFAGLEKIHEELIKKGAEGTMIRDPESYYEGKRSKYLLKYKPFQDDEAVVQGFEFGTGKNTEVMGKLRVQWFRKNQDKQIFSVGSGFTDTERKNYKKLYPKGAIIKVKYFGFTSSGKPRFPIFLSVIPKKMVH